MTKKGSHVFNEDDKPAGMILTCSKPTETPCNFTWSFLEKNITNIQELTYLTETVNSSTSTLKIDNISKFLNKSLQCNCSGDSSLPFRITDELGKVIMYLILMFFLYPFHFSHFES